MKKLLLAAALAGTMIGGAAYAGQSDSAGQPAPTGHRGGGFMMRADTNGDGKISRAEFMTQADARFARMDKNGDGVITADELPGRGGERLMAADADHDGKISKAEFTAWNADRFAKMDANGDGQVTPDEMRAAMAQMRAASGFGGRHRGAAADDATPGAADDAGPGRGHGHHHRRDMLARLDTNHDGKISRDEMRAGLDKRFDKLDTNHDGFVDKAELDAAHAKMKEKFAERRAERAAAAPGATPPPPPPPPPPAQ